MTFYRQAQSTEFTKHNDLCATEQIRAWHNGFQIVMQVNNMTYGMEVAAAGTVHQTGGVMLHGPLDNFFRLELTPGFIERNPYDNGREKSETRRVGKEGVSTCRSRWAPYH